MIVDKILYLIFHTCDTMKKELNKHQNNLEFGYQHLTMFLVFSFILFTCSCQDKQTASTVNYDYLTYLPSDYQEDEFKNWPLIIFLHGASLRGNDLQKLNKFGIPKLIKEGREFDFIIISPQCPANKDWTTENWFPATYNEIREKFRIDTNRVYLTGLSLGGEGTWYISEQYPDIFAAISPVCGRVSHIPSILKESEEISSLPIWIFHGALDKVYSVKESDKMYSLLKDLNPNIRYTRYPDLGHGATHDTTYKDPELYNWFLSHYKIK